MWFVVCYGVAVWAGLVGSVLLLARQGLARRSTLSRWWRWWSCSAGCSMRPTSSHKGVLVATGFPIVIAVIAVLEIWLAGTARRRGWIGRAMTWPKLSATRRPSTA